MTEPRAIRRALVVSLHSNCDVGDAMLTDVTVRQLSEAFPGAHVTLAMNYPDYSMASPGVTVLPSLIADSRDFSQGGARWRHGTLLTTALDLALNAATRRLLHRRWPWTRPQARALLEEIDRADVVMSCAGNVFFTMGRAGLPFLAAALSVGYVRLLGKPLYVLPQTVGPIDRGWERRLLRWLYSRAGIIFVRDEGSARLLRQVGLGNGRLVPDLGFAYSGNPEVATTTDARLPFLADARRPIVAVTVINRILRRIPDEAWAWYEQAVASAVAAFLTRHGGTAVFLPQVTGPGSREDDRAAARRVVDLMPAAREQAICVDEALPPEVLRSAYSRCDVVLGTRLHSVILALTVGTPSLAIEYLAKTEDMMRSLGLEEWLLRLTTLDADSLTERLEALYERRDSVRQHLARTVPDVVARSQGVGAAIAADLACPTH